MFLDYVLKFILGGTIIVLATYFSRSRHLFLSGIITLLPIMTLINMRLQIKNMTLKDFRLTQRNAIFGAIGAVILLLSVFILTNWIKPIHAVLISLAIYLIYMLMCKYFL